MSFSSRRDEGCAETGWADKGHDNTKAEHGGYCRVSRSHFCPHAAPILYERRRTERRPSPLA